VTLAPKITIVITTYGTDDWRELAWSRAYPSTVDQDAHEVIVHHEPDLPIGPARNAAALLASGDHLVFLDADDELAPGYVSAMGQAIRDAKDPSLILGYPTVRYMRKNRAQPDLLRPVSDLRHDNFMVIGTVIGNDLFRSVGGFSNYDHGYEDWSLWAKAWKAGGVVTPVPLAVYIAHINPQSAHRVRWRNRQEQVAGHMRVQAELFPEGV
jgi:glycosyltransferase involved in cell wall biosynthesis